MYNKILQLRRWGYDFRKPCETHTVEELEKKIKENGIDLEGYALSKNCYFRCIEDSADGTTCLYELDKYGSLIYYENSNLYGAPIIDVYHNGVEYRIDGFDYPNYAYAFEGDTMWYAGRKDQDIHIIKITPNEYEVVVKDTTETDNDMDAYLVEYLKLHEKSFPMTPWEIKELSVEDILSELSADVKNKLYDALRKEHLADDVRSVDADLTTYAVNVICEHYVAGEYDCNLSYWNNIDNLIKKYKEGELKKVC